jgi:hypothetical protein
MEGRKEGVRKEKTEKIDKRNEGWKEGRKEGVRKEKTEKFDKRNEGRKEGRKEGKKEEFYRDLRLPHRSPKFRRNLVPSSSEVNTCKRYASPCPSRGGHCDVLSKRRQPRPQKHMATSKETRVFTRPLMVSKYY